MQQRRLPALAENTTVRNWARWSTGQMQIPSRDSPALNEHPNLGLGSNLDEKATGVTGCRTRGTVYILKNGSTANSCHSVSDGARLSDDTFISSNHTPADLCNMLLFKQ